MSQSPVVSLRFCVFSYNRGQFLENCIESIARCAPFCPVTIFDDNSDDPVTCDVLARLRRTHEVVQPGQSHSGKKHGGLYANMQSALERAPDGELLCFIQDDMQIVRALSGAEVASINGHFVGARPVFVQPAFFKGCTQGTDAALTRYDEEAGAYHVDRFERSAGTFYSDVVIFSVSALRAVDWEFLPREALNEQQARQKMGQMRLLRNPFVAWLPAAPAYRGKTRTRALKWAQRRNGCGFHPFHYMTDAQAQALCERPATQLPVAEAFLHTRGERPKEPWIYHPLQNQRALKLLHSLELALK